MSEQQKLALLLALENRLVEKRHEASQGADLYEYEILQENPLFAQNRWKWTFLQDKKRSPGGHRFCKSSIGSKAYKAAHASVSRTFKRLEERGLAVRVKGAVPSHWTGINLTSDGLAEATRLRTAKLAPTDAPITTYRDCDR